MSIDREKLLQAIKSTEQLPILSRMEKVVEYIQQAEDVERHAHWEIKAEPPEYQYMTIICSGCKDEFVVEANNEPFMPYCPDCGCKMDEVTA